MTKRNRSRSGAQVECPHCGRKLRGEKGLKMHMAEAHAVPAQNCPGHVAGDDPKVCARCGIHIDELRP